VTDAIFGYWTSGYESIKVEAKFCLNDGLCSLMNSDVVSSLVGKAKMLADISTTFNDESGDAYSCGVGRLDHFFVKKWSF
jgi:hypothetical protein